LWLVASMQNGWPSFTYAFSVTFAAVTYTQRANSLVAYLGNGHF
jgi:hypothetical protein